MKSSYFIGRAGKDIVWHPRVLSVSWTAKHLFLGVAVLCNARTSLWAKILHACVFGNPATWAEALAKTIRIALKANTNGQVLPRIFQKWVDSPLSLQQANSRLKRKRYIWAFLVIGISFFLGGNSSLTTRKPSRAARTVEIEVGVYLVIESRARLPAFDYRTLMLISENICKKWYYCSIPEQAC